MTIALWSSDAWRQEAVAWLDERLAADGTRRVGEVTQPHLRPWATVLRVPTTRGVVWLKAAGPETAFEVELYGLLERVVPERILVVGCEPQVRMSGDEEDLVGDLSEPVRAAVGPAADLVENLLGDLLAENGSQNGGTR